MADRTSGAVRRFTLSLRPVAVGVVSALLLTVLVVVGLRQSTAAAMAELARANARLHVENASYREATGELSSQIASLQGALDDLGARAAVDPAANLAMERLPAVVRSRAMGGGGDTAFSAAIAGAVAPDNPFGVLREILGAIANRLDTVRSGVERRQALAAATPSIWPVAGWLSSAYGTRRDPFTGSADFHPGLDISADHGEPVHATADGVVSSAGQNGAYGNLVVIDHSYGIITRYGHLSRFTVSGGQRVRRGDVIGHVGSTGRSTSPHLHYEILTNGTLTNPLKLLARP
ncbi:MAG: M23 family metallopeptidase [Acidobacteria bacterium]|nr:M23 family metallopeptidase [Acidobacteriota bacterium]